MISAPRIVVVSVIFFFPMGLFYYSSANGTDYNQRRPHSALAYRPPAPEAQLPMSQALDPIPWSGFQMVLGSNLEGSPTRGTGQEDLMEGCTSAGMRPGGTLCLKV